MFYLKRLKILYCTTKKVAKTLKSWNAPVAPLNPLQKKTTNQPTNQTQSSLRTLIQKEVLHLVIHCEDVRSFQDKFM